jgi:hypothetical protein
MQEQANEKTVGLVCRTSRLTARHFLRLCDRYLRHRDMMRRDRKMSKRADPSKQEFNQPRKIKVKQLVKEGQGVSTVEIKDEKIREFEKLARQYGVRYAIKKDKSTMPPTFIVFFKAKDGEMIDRVMKEFLKKNVKREKPKEPVLKQRLDKFKEMAKETVETISKIRHKAIER